VTWTRTDRWERSVATSTAGPAARATTVNADDALLREHETCPASLVQSDERDLLAPADDSRQLWR